MKHFEERLKRLEKLMKDFREEIKVIISHSRIDIQTTLNKIRYTVEKMMYKLCEKNETFPGKQETTIENMIGPLVSAKIIPKSIGSHIRTIQNYTSPGSHYNKDVPNNTQLLICMPALLEIMDWYVKLSGDEYSH